MKNFKLNYTNNLKKIRSSKLLSQEELARLTGLSRNTICSYERNEYEPTLKNAYIISAVLGCDILEIFNYNYKLNI